MYSVNSIKEKEVMVKKTGLSEKSLSLDDIDELTYMLTLGLKRNENYDRGSSQESASSSTFTNFKLLEESRNNEIDKTTEAKVDEPAESESSSSEDSSIKSATVAVSDKVKCMQYMDFEHFAEMFVNEIIDVSVEVCENLYNAAIGESDEIVVDVPCTCTQVIEHVITPATNTGGTEVRVSIQEPDEAEEIPEEVDTKQFSGWPTIQYFNVKGAKMKIMEFMEQFHFVEDWKYTLTYFTSYSDMVSDFHLFRAMWSIPTKEYPIAQATASIFFTIEVSRVKPKCCLVNVTMQFEGSSSIHKAGKFEFIEHWLFNIIDSKINFFKTLKF